MDEFIFDIKEDLTFNKMKSQSKRRNILISLAIFVVTSLVSDWRYGLAITIFFFIVQTLKATRWNKYFINHIELSKGHVTIKYTSENQEMILTGNKDEVMIKKKIAFNRIRTAYLAIYKNGNLQIKQFEEGEWTEKIFDKVILAFEPPSSLK